MKDDRMASHDGGLLSGWSASLLMTRACAGCAQGFQSLPQHCLQLMIGWFVAAILINVIRDALPSKYSVAVPIPMAMAIPFFIGANVAIDIGIGALVKAYWDWRSPGAADGKVGPLYLRVYVISQCAVSGLPLSRGHAGDVQACMSRQGRVFPWTLCCMFALCLIRLRQRCACEPV
jgi:hypothetical protein